MYSLHDDRYLTLVMSNSIRGGFSLNGLPEACESLFDFICEFIMLRIKNDIGEEQLEGCCSCGKTSAKTVAVNVLDNSRERNSKYNRKGYGYVETPYSFPMTTQAEVTSFV